MNSIVMSHKEDGVFNWLPAVCNFLKNTRGVTSFKPGLSERKHC